MTDKKVTAILFDLGKVLIDFDHAVAVGKFAALAGKTPEQIIELFIGTKLSRWFEEGRYTPEEFYAAARRRLRLKVGYEQFVKIWNSIFFTTAATDETLALAQRLGRRHAVAVLSNVNQLHLEFIRNNYRILDGFQRVFASCEMGCMKPAGRIYTSALQELGCRPAEVFYTDDRPDFIAKARSMGIRAFVYTGPDQLKKDLDRCGIEIPA